MGVSENRGTPKSSILLGLSIINHPFWGTTIFGNTHMAPQKNHLERIDGATPMYWLFRGPLLIRRLGREWLAIYFHYGVYNYIFEWMA